MDKAVEDMVDTLHNPRWALSGAITDQSPIALECMQYGQPGIFIASPVDPEPQGVEVWNKAKAGDYGPIGDYVAPPQTVDEAMSQQVYEVRIYMQGAMVPRPPGPDRQLIYTELEAAGTTQGYHFSQVPKPWTRPVEITDQEFFDAGEAAYTETIDYLNAQLRAHNIVLPPIKLSKLRV